MKVLIQTCAFSLLSVLVFCSYAQGQAASAEAPVLAGRGQDLLMIVNPNDENALRIAEAYKPLRNIPDNNIIKYAPPEIEGFTRLSLPANQFWGDFVRTIYQEIQNRRIGDQIDFILVVGQPHSFNDLNGNFQSMSYGLTQLDQYFAGMSVAAGQNQSFGIASLSSVGALHHSDTYDGVSGSTTGTQRYYASGFLGITAQFGNSANRVIAGLQRSVAADGMKPQGRIYFEENDNIRSNIREPQWPSAQAELAASNIPFVQESDVPGATPMGRSDVRGAVIGFDEAIAPNGGSPYLPGSWVDNLTSFGGVFTDSAQTKLTDFIAAGAAASSGTIAEPTATATRFPMAEIFSHIDSGLTLVEAFYQAVVDPDMIQFVGDPLAQPYADIPMVWLTADQEFATVSETIAIDAAATPRGETSVDRLELYVDGSLFDTLGDPGRFNVDTMQLSDGIHEFRVVAIADNAAESEGISIRRLHVENHGRSIAVAQQVHDGNDLDTIQIQLATAQGDGSINRIELRHLGGQVASASGSVTAIGLAIGQLAFGENTITPVAVFDDGHEVLGAPFIVNRHPELLPGGIIPAMSEQTPGIRAEYFFSGGTEAIETSDFSGAPDIDTIHDAVDLADNANFQTFATSETDELNDLAVRLTGSFSVAADSAGEYVWSAIRTSDSFRLLVDGREILSYDNKPFGLDRANGSTSLFLGEGRHDFEILYANTAAGDGPVLNVVLRAPDGDTRTLSGEFVYTVEPTRSFLLGDCNQDGEVNFFDINVFISILSASSYLEEADCNEDGEVNFFDIAPFIAILAGQ